jgi:hypothetical protein
VGGVDGRCVIFVCFIYHLKLKEKEQEKTTILRAPVEVLSY